MNVRRLSAFSDGQSGGNPAGVVLLNEAVDHAEMARVAAAVGFSETAFAVRQDESGSRWRVRYFSPESEVPFCGHATIALGSELAREQGAGTFVLELNEATIEVEAAVDGMHVSATLTSPPTKSRPSDEAVLAQVLELFDLGLADLDDRLPPARIHGGADHMVLSLTDRSRLAAMSYDLDAGRELMKSHGLVTIMLVYIDADQTFFVRNAFASGGVLEDPATGAAAAAFAGYLRDQRWPHGGRFRIHQGDDMGQPSIIDVELDGVTGAPVRVSGLTHLLD